MVQGVISTTPESILENRAALVGSPEEVVDQVAMVREAFGEVEPSLQMNFGGMSEREAFCTLDVLVAMDEGLFATEGLDLRMASRESRDIRSTTEGTLSSPVTNQGRLAERGDATMFQG